MKFLLGLIVGFTIGRPSTLNSLKNRFNSEVREDVARKVYDFGDFITNVDIAKTKKENNR